MFIFHNENPDKKRTIDCVIRGVSFVLNQDWETTFIHIAVECIKFHDMPEANYVWAEYLRSRGFKRYMIPDTCPYCYTVKDFCRDNPAGTYLLVIVGWGGSGGHVVAMKDGNYYDIWDSGNEIPTYYWVKATNNKA